MVKHPIWIVVADGEHACMLTTGEKSDSYHTIEEIDARASNFHTSYLITNAAESFTETPIATSHPPIPHADAHQQAKHEFANRLAAFVGLAAEKDIFERLIMIAPAHALYDLRAALPAIAQAKLIGVLQHDLTKTPDHQIGKHVIWDVLHGGTLTA